MKVIDWGNAWKSILTRMQQVKAGVDVDDMGEPLKIFGAL